MSKLPPSDTTTTTTKEVDDTVPLKPTVLTTDTFDRVVAEDYTFVDFFAPWCTHCVRFEPTWNELADTYRYRVYEIPFLTLVKK